MSFQDDVQSAVTVKLANLQAGQPQADPMANIPPELLAQLMGQQGQTAPQSAPQDIDPQQLEAILQQLIAQQGAPGSTA